jgi:hypothetical protein
MVTILAILLEHELPIPRIRFHLVRRIDADGPQPGAEKGLDGQTGKRALA